MSGTFLVMGNAHNSWLVIGAWATKDLAVTDADKIRRDSMRPHDKKIAKNPPTKWRFWKEKKVTQGGYTSLGTKFPGRLVRLWSANSVGGVDGNIWSYIAVVELEVQGTVLDKIVEVL